MWMCSKLMIVDLFWLNLSDTAWISGLWFIAALGLCCLRSHSEARLWWTVADTTSHQRDLKLNKNTAQRGSLPESSWCAVLRTVETDLGCWIFSVSLGFQSECSSESPSHNRIIQLNLADPVETAWEWS